MIPRTRIIRTLSLQLALVVCCASLAGSAAAQVPGSRVVRDWVAQQRSAMASEGPLTFRARTSRQMQGPFGDNMIEYRGQLIGGMEGVQDERVVGGMHVNGLPGRGPGRRGGQEGRGGFAVPGPDRLVNELLLPYRLIGRMDVLDETPGRLPEDRLAQRIRLAPRQASRGPLQEMTLWFDASGERLLKLEAEVNPVNRPGTSEVTVTYARVGGLDLPSEAVVKGLVQSRRRARTFTHAFRTKTVYSDFSKARE